MTGTGTNTYVLGEERFAVVDPGPLTEPHLQQILHMCASGKIEQIWLTHAHPDHANGIPRLMELTQAKLLSFPVPAPTYPIPNLPAPDIIACDGNLIRWEEHVWEIFHTPGHASDHLCFFRRDDGGLLTGDLIVGAGTVVIAPPDGNMQAYFHSLKRLLALGPKVLWPGHGEPISCAQEKIEEYLSHRLQRERQIMATLHESGPTSLDSLVKQIYAPVSPALHPIAARQLHAHLLKLSAEGVAASDANEQWSLL